MAISVAALIDRSKALADRRVDASIPDTDWLTYVNWAVEDLYRYLVSLDPGTYFQTIDFTLAGGAAGATFNLDLAFVVRVATVAALPACTPSGVGPGHTLLANANGVLTVDGVATVINDRILVKNQAAASDNGIYFISQEGTAGQPFRLQRAPDFDQVGPLEVQLGAIATATAGTTLANSPCVLTTFAGVIDTSPQTWTNLPLYTRFRSLHGLDINPDTTVRMTIGRRNFRERNLGAVGPWSPTLWASDRRYDMRGSLLYITPFESAAGTYRAYYRAAPYVWSSPTDTDPLDAPLEVYNEYIPQAAARRAVAIEEGDTGPFDMRLAEMKESIAGEHQRDDEPATIADVEDTFAGVGWRNWP